MYSSIVLNGLTEIHWPDMFLLAPGQCDGSLTLSVLGADQWQVCVLADQLVEL